ncbi:MAG: hypothetical protein K0A98_11015 [Trueperaceae bacterium]|nr:hypothetical protein [Trueperaceae bacterium]
MLRAAFTRTPLSCGQLQGVAANALGLPAAAFATLFERDGCDEGQNVTGERLFAHQSTMARGPQAGEPVAGGPRGRR